MQNGLLEGRGQAGDALELTVMAQLSEDHGWGQCRRGGGAEEKGGMLSQSCGFKPNSVMHQLGEPGYGIEPLLFLSPWSSSKQCSENKMRSQYIKAFPKVSTSL